MGLFGGGGLVGGLVSGVGSLVGGAGNLIGGAGNMLFGGGGSNQSVPGAPAPVDYNPGMIAMAEASKANMAMFVGGQVQQTQMQTNMMNLMGQRMQMMEQGKLDTKLEIAGMKQEADMQEAQYRHDEKLLSLLNTHIEELVDDGMIDPDQLDLG